MNIFSAGVIDADGDIYPGGLEPGTVIYTADQLAAVVQQRDELLAALQKIADLQGAWGPFPETNKSWAGMAIVTAREVISKVQP